MEFYIEIGKRIAPGLSLHKMRSGDAHCAESMNSRARSRSASVAKEFSIVPAFVSCAQLH